MMMDQADILRDYAFPTVMLLPLRGGTTPAGLATGIRRFVDRLGRSIVLYIKHDGMIDVETVQRLTSDGLISWIKYAIVREDPRQDPFLRSLVESVGVGRVVSGIGEQPAIVHLRDFGLMSFTSGCVCIAPAFSMAMLRAIQRKAFSASERIREQFAHSRRFATESTPCACSTPP